MSVKYLNSCSSEELAEIVLHAISEYEKITSRDDIAAAMQRVLPKTFEWEQWVMSMCIVAAMNSSAMRKPLPGT